MRPVLIHVGPVNIYSYGFMLFTSFITAFVLTRMELKRKGFNPDLAYELMLWFAVLGIIGARLAYVLLNFSEFASNLIRVFAIWEGGLTFFGGFILAALAFLLIARIRELPVKSLADAIVPGLALGAAITRVGCFLNGCCYGCVTDSVLGVRFPGTLGGLRHPTQLYHSLANLSIFIVLMLVRRRVKTPGNLFWLYILLYSVGRFVVEFFRADMAKLGSLTYSQVITIGTFLLAAFILILSSKRTEQNTN